MKPIKRRTIRHQNDPVPFVSKMGNSLSIRNPVTGHLFNFVGRNVVFVKDYDDIKFLSSVKSIAKAKNVGGSYVVDDVEYVRKEIESKIVRPKSYVKVSSANLSIDKDVIVTRPRNSISYRVSDGGMRVNSRKSVSCPHCGNVYPSEESFNRHMRFRHSK